MPSLLVIVRAVFKNGLLQISFILKALLQVTWFRQQLFIINNLFLSLLNFKLFFKLLNVKNFIVVLRLIIYACFLAFNNLKRFSLDNLRIDLHVCVNHTFILIVNRLISICIILLRIFNYLLIKTFFLQNCIIG